MLPILYNAPSTESEWNIWSLSHSASHTKILQAIKAQKSLSLSQYQLDPIAFNAVDVFLNNNQQAHNDMLGALGISGADLQQVDLKDENQRRAWIYIHAVEHRDAEMALKV